MKSGYSIAGILASIFVFILPFVVSRSLFYGASNAKYFFVLVSVSVFALWYGWLIFKGKQSLNLKNRWLLLGALVFLLVHYLAAFTGVFPERSLWSDILRSTGVLFLTYIFFLAFFLSELLSEKDWSLVRRSVVVSVAIISIFTFLGHEGAGVGGRFLTINLDIDGLTFGNSTFAGVYLLLAFVLTLIELARTEHRKVKIFLWILLVIQFLSPILINSKILIGKSSFDGITSILGTARASSATMLLLIAYLLGWYLLRKIKLRDRVSKWRVLWPIIFGIFVLSVVAMLFVPGSFVREKYTEESTAARLIVWDSGIEAFKEKPLLGWGPENFRLAYEKYFDNRLYLDENIGEVWFDRGHNLVIDSLVSIGIVGVVFGVALFLYFIMVVIRAWRRGLIGSFEANILGAFPLAHFLQLQTGFDTAGTYALVAVIFGYVLYLERKMIVETSTNIAESLWVLKVAGSALVVLVIIASVPLIFREHTRQRALVDIFRTIDNTEQIELINKALSRPSNFESLRMASGSFVKGWVSQIGATPPEDRQSLVENGKMQLNLYLENFERYLENYPDDYRVRMNYAYTLLVRTAFGEPSTDQAKEIVSTSYDLSPGNPLTYALDAVVEMYGGNFTRAREIMNEAIVLNPNIEFSKQVLAYIDEQEKNLPHVTILKLENL